MVRWHLRCTRKRIEKAESIQPQGFALPWGLSTVVEFETPKICAAAYWDPSPYLASLTGEVSFEREDGVWDRLLSGSASNFTGRWAERNWRNVPGPLYAATTDSAWNARSFAPHHLAYSDEYGQELLFRQPRSEYEVLLIARAADVDPFGGWAADGDRHWTPDLVREWWRERSRVEEWIAADLSIWQESDRWDERDAAEGLREYGDYLRGDLERHLRGYIFWLSEGRVPQVDERLPHL